jgi:hypothetical protein
MGKYLVQMVFWCNHTNMEYRAESSLYMIFVFGGVPFNTHFLPPAMFPCLDPPTSARFVGPAFEVENVGLIS